MDVSSAPRRWTTRDRFPTWPVPALLAATGAVLLLVSQAGSIGTSLGLPLAVVSVVGLLGRLWPWHASTEVDSLGADVRGGLLDRAPQRVEWSQVRRVVPAAGWQVRSWLLLRDGRCVPLCGVDRRGARHLARRLERARRG